MADTTPEQRTREHRLAQLLTLAMLAGVGACVFVMVYFQDEAARAVEKYAADLPSIVNFYLTFTDVAFIFPIGIWIAAVAITRLGRTRQDAAKLMIAVLFAFALLWPAGAWFAFVYVMSNLT